MWIRDGVDMEDVGRTLAKKLGYEPSTREVTSALRGYLAAVNEEPLDLWSVRRMGNDLFEQSEISRDEIEPWIRRNQEACRRGYEFEIEVNDHIFDGAGKPVRTVGRSEPSGSASILESEVEPVEDRASTSTLLNDHYDLF